MRSTSAGSAACANTPGVRTPSPVTSAVEQVSTIWGTLGSLRQMAWAGAGERRAGQEAG
jgi:hypothetical protein